MLCSMDLMLLRTFQKQIALQCEFVLKAANDINSALQLGDINGIFGGIQSLLSAAANIAKALWSQEEARGPLRASLGVRDDSPLRELRMRHNFEHFDERLDRWWRESRQRNYADLNVGSKDAIAGIAEIDRFRWFDPRTTDVMFWGESFNIQKIVDEVKHLHPVAIQESRKPHWETGNK